jgi:hypothetical protein
MLDIFSFGGGYPPIYQPSFPSYGNGYMGVPFDKFFEI